MFRALLTAFTLASTVLPAALRAETGSYVPCDNGIDCVTQPCPSMSALNVQTGTVIRGVFMDVDRLTEAERERLREDDLLYFGRVVITGAIVQRQKTFHGRAYDLPFLVASGIERQSTSEEQRLCRGN